MRIVLLLLFAFLPLLPGEDEVNPAQLIDMCQRQAGYLDERGSQLSAAAAQAGMALPAELTARVQAGRDDLIGHVARLRAGGVDKPGQAAALASRQRGDDLGGAAEQLAQHLHIFASYAGSTLPAAGMSVERYLEPLRAFLVSEMAQVATTGKRVEHSPEVEAGRRSNYFALRLVSAQRLLGKSWTRLPADHPAVGAFASWVAAARARLDDELVQSPPTDTEERRRQEQHRSQAIDLAERRLSSWQWLLTALNERLACDLPPFSAADGAALPALRVALEQRAAHERKALDLLGERDVLSLQQYEELGALDSARQRLGSVEDAAREAIEQQRSLAGSRAGIVERLAGCSDEVRKDLLGRFDQVAAERSKQQGRRLKALAEEERVDAVEAEGEMELLQIRLEALDDDAGTEQWLAEIEAPWRAKAKDPALRENAARFRDQRGKLADARAKVLKQRLQQQQVRNRVALLNLKDELTGNQIGVAEEAVQRVRSELDQLHEDLKDAAARGGERVKDAKDAERIPLVKPGVDDF